MTSFVTRAIASTTLASWGAAAGLAMAAAVAQAQTEVRVLVPYNSPDTGRVYEAAAEGFEAEHPGIDIRIEVVGWDRLYQRLTGETGGGSDPDVAIVATRWLVDFVANDTVVPLDDYMTPAFRDLFIPAFLEPTEIDGRIWGLPAAASARALYYNRLLFAEAGIAAPPATWEQLEADARALSVLGEDIHGFGLQGDEIETDIYFYYAMWAHGGELTEADGSSGLDSDGAIAAAELYRRLIDEGLTQPDVTAHSREDLQGLFRTGRLGMMITGPWMGDVLAQDSPGLEYAVAPIPAATRSATFGITDSAVLFASSQVKHEAWQFLEFIFQPGIRSDIAEGFLPTTVAIADRDLTGSDPVRAAFAATLPDARFLPTIPNWEVVADVTSNALRRIYRGDQPVREALEAAAAEIDSILGQ